VQHRAVRVRRFVLPETAGQSEVVVIDLCYLVAGHRCTIFRSCSTWSFRSVFS
jgi:hypothetical protein